jgi:uncharacterized repeat protein (TIGR01451 family)
VGGSFLYGAPAGQAIDNRAEGVYDTPAGAAAATQSSTGSLTVLAIAALSAVPDDAVVTGFVAPVAGIDRLFTVTNQANRADRFRVTAAAVTPPAMLTALFFDLNGNGAVDGADPSVTIGVSQSPLLPSGGSLGVLMRYSAAGLPDGTPIALTLTAESLEPGAANGLANDGGTIRDQVSGGAVFSDPANPGQPPAKTADGQARLMVAPGQVIDFALAFANSGTVAATNTIVSDPLAAGLAYVPGSLTLDGTPLSDAPDGDAGEVAGATVIVRIPSVAPGASHRVAFRAQVGSGLPNGTLLDNAATVAADGVGPALSSRIVLLVDPFGMIFEGSGGAPIAGVNLSLLSAPPPAPLLPLAPAAGAGAPPNVDNLNPFTSDPTGRYSFLLDAAQIGAPGAPAVYVLHAARTGFLDRVVQIAVEPSPGSTPAAPLYTLTVAALDSLPLASPGGTSLVAGPISIPDVAAVGFNLPLFPDTPLVLAKAADRSHAMVGESVGYRVEIFNGGVTPVLGLTLDDLLPEFFDLVEGASRVTAAGATVPIEPAQSGRAMSFALGDLPAGERFVVSYRARVAPGAPSAAAANQATAAGTLPSGDPTGAGPAQAVVFVKQGIFSFQQALIGRVYEDLDGDGEFAAGDRPLPDVRLVLDNGMSVTTDGEGLYSLPSVPEGARMIALDPATYPPGYCPPDPAQLSDTGPSRLLRTALRGGTLLKQNFVLARRPTCPTQPPPQGPGGIDAMEEGAPFKGRAVAESGTPESRGPEIGTPESGPGEGGPAPSPEAIEEEPLPPGTYISRQTEDLPPVPPGALLVLEPRDGEVAMSGAVRIVARTHRQGTVRLAVNDRSIDAARIGRTVLDDRNQLATFTFVGVPVDPGPNRVTIRVEADDVMIGAQADMTVYGRGPVASLRIVPDRPGLAADGEDRSAVRVELIDAWGHPAQDARVRVTSTAGLLADDGEPEAGRDRAVASRDGVARITLISDRSTGPVTLRAEYGALQATASVLFEPLTRPDLLVGIVDLTYGAVGSDPAVGEDPATLEEGATGRVAFFYKGAVRNGVVLTTAFDSEGSLNRHAEGDRLHELDPLQEVYPVMGDDSIRFQEAVSNSRGYLKLEKERSYLLYGDFEPGMTDTRLAADIRQLTGVKLNLEDADDDLLRLAVAPTDTSFAREVIPASGIGGLYRLGHDNVIPGSERITLEVHDRRNPETVLDSDTLTRGIDYDFDALGGVILFKRSLSRFDPQFNLVEIVVVYEFETTGFEGLTWSGRGRKGWDGGASRLGFSAIGDSEDGGDDFQLYAVDFQRDFAGSGALSIEAAHSEGQPLNLGNASLGAGADEDGAAWRVEFEREIAHLRGPLRLLYSEVEAEFLNPFGASLTPGNRTYAFSLEPRLGERFRLGVRVQDETNRTPNVDNTRTTGSVELRAGISEQISVVGGWDHRDFLDNLAGTAIGSDLLSGGVDYRPGPRFKVALRREQNLGSAADPSFPDSTFLNAAFQANPEVNYFLRFRDSDAAIEAIADVGAAGLTLPRSRRELQVGAESRLGTHSVLSSRYQIENGMAGDNAYAVLGLGTRLPVSESFAADFAGEAGLDVAGTGEPFSSFSGGLTWLPREAFKTTFRYEFIDAAGTGQTVTAGALGKPSDDLTLLASLAASDADQFGRRTTEVRFLGGLAVRPLRRDDFGLLFAWKRNDRHQRGPADADAVRTLTDTLSADGVIDLTARLRFFGKVALSFVSDTPAGLPTVSTTVSLGQTRLEYRFARRWDVAGEVRDLWLWDDDLRRDSAGAELGFWATQDLRLGLGYGYTASQPLEGHEAAVRDGVYFNLTTKMHRILQLLGREP